MDLPKEFHKGKVLACALLCDMTMKSEDIPFEHEYLCRFYSAIHKGVISNQQVLLTLHNI